MRKITLILLMLPIGVFGQSFKPDPDTRSSYKNEPAYLLDTVAESRLTKQQLFSNAMNYVTKSFKDSRAVLEMENLELGEIAFNGQVPIIFTDTIRTEKKKKVVEEIYSDRVDMRFKCKIYVKDQKFKIVLYSMEVPMSSLLDVALGLSMESERTANQEAKMIAMDMIIGMTSFINRPPANEF
ncbi:MAG: DUF4468 domain-containing protein [Chitinophagaceae bacterium]|nr:DUF4468 domain-containing protein [Chitinophagaceae bacterium]